MNEGELKRELEQAYDKVDVGAFMQEEAERRDMGFQHIAFPDKPANWRGAGRHSEFNWAEVDWEFDNADIACDLGCTVPAVLFQRKKSPERMNALAHPTIVFASDRERNQFAHALIAVVECLRREALLIEVEESLEQLARDGLLLKLDSGAFIARDAAILRGDLVMHNGEWRSVQFRADRLLTEFVNER